MLEGKLQPKEFNHIQEDTRKSNPRSSNQKRGGNNLVLWQQSNKNQQNTAHWYFSTSSFQFATKNAHTHRIEAKNRTHPSAISKKHTFTLTNPCSHTYMNYDKFKWNEKWEMSLKPNAKDEAACSVAGLWQAGITKVTTPQRAACCAPQTLYWLKPEVLTLCS